MLLILCLVGFASSVAWRAVDPMLQVMASDLHVSLGDAALLSAAYSFTFALMQLVFGPLGDLLGKERMIKASLGMVAASMVFMALAPSFGYAVLARMLGGAFAGGLGPMSLALIGDRIPFAVRQIALGRFRVAAIFGQMLGASIAGFLVDRIGWRPVFGLAACVVGMICVIAVIRLRAPAPAAARAAFRNPITTYKALLRDPLARMVFAILFCEGALVLGQTPFVVGLTRAHEALDSTAAGLLLAAFAAGGVLYGLVVKTALRVLGPWNMLRGGGLITGAALALTALPVHWTWFIANFFIAGLGFYTMHGTVQARATELAPGARGAALAMVSFSFYAGQGLGPVLGGRLSSWAGYGVSFGLAGLLVIGLGTMAASRIRHHAGAHQ
jgi:predicted MFS family arabinose efflux permease